MDEDEIKSKACKLLADHIKAFKTCCSEQEIGYWHDIAILYTQRIYGNECNQAYMVSKVPDAKDIITFFEGFIKDIKALGLPQNSNFTGSKNEVTVNTNQHISQTQNIKLNIIFETIKDELPPARLREIEEITKSKEPKESKLTKIAEKLKETGVEVISSILAKIINQSMGV